MPTDAIKCKETGGVSASEEGLPPERWHLLSSVGCPCKSFPVWHLSPCETALMSLGAGTVPLAAQPGQPGAAQSQLLHGSLGKVFPAAASVPHGGTGQGSQLGPCHCSAGKRGCILRWQPKVVCPELLKPLVSHSAAAGTLLGQRYNENIKHQIQVHWSPTTFSLLPSGQRFPVLPPTSSLFCFIFPVIKRLDEL